MSEHRIRLRGAWTWSGIDTPGMSPQRLELPTRWLSRSIDSIHLSRRFGRPPYNPALEQIRLELIRVPGLRRVRLNERVWELPGIDVGEWSIPIQDGLLGRNNLELVVDLSVAAGSADLWGSIALVITSDPAIEG